MDTILLEKIKKYIERTEVTMDGEWGSCQNLKQLIANDEMPDIYWEVCALLKKNGK